MSAVNAAQNAARHGLKAVRTAAKGATTTIIRDEQQGVPKTIDTTSSSPSIQRDRSNGLITYERGAKGLQASSNRRQNDQDPVTKSATTTHPSQKRSKHVPNPSQQPPLLTFIHDPFPKPINCTTLTPTKMFLTDPSHPLHIRTQRRLAALDPSKLTWRVQVPVAVSKKPAIRREAEKRVKNAVRAELGVLGFGEDGRILEGMGGDGQEVDGKKGLSGALLMIMNKDPVRSLTFRSEEVREEVRRWVGRVMRERERGGRGEGRGDWKLRQDNTGIKRLSLKDGMLEGANRIGQG